MIPPSTTITEEGRRIRRTLLWLAAGVVGLNLVIWVASGFTAGGAVSGPGGSSFVTTRSGTAALAGMLERLDVGVGQSRRPLDEAALEAGDTLMVIEVGEADYTSDELNAIEAFLRRGGRVVVAGRASMVERLLADPPVWRSAGSSVGVPTEIFDPVVARVPLSGFGSLRPGEGDVVVLEGPESTPVGVARAVGEGTFVWIADSYPFLNEGIGREDAAVAVASLVDSEGTVIFDELRHGFREGGSVWSVIPDRWRTLLLLMAVVGGLALVSYGRRLGPPFDIERRLAPGREAYLESVAGMLGRAGGRRDALAMIRQEGRRLLLDRAPGADPWAAARAAGLEGAEVDALLGEGTDDDTLVAVDRALASLNREKE